MSGEISSGLELALAEVRFRKDFVVIHRAMRDGRPLVKRTPAVPLWTAMQWIRMCRDQPSDVTVELAPANRQTLGLRELVRAVGAVDCEGD